MSQHLLEWARHNKTQLHPSVKIYQDEVTGLSFRVTHDIDAGTSLVECAYETTLSYLNAIEASPIFSRHDAIPFPAEFLNTLSQDDPNIIGYFFLIQQYLLKEKSFWWEYIKLLPQPNEPERLPIPILWPEGDQKFLDGTNAEPAIRKRRLLWEAEWSSAVNLLESLSKEVWEEYTFALYQWAAAIFGSRSFRPSLTISPENFPSGLQNGVTINHIAKDTFSILLPVLDIGNHNGHNEVDWNRTLTSFRLLNNNKISQGSQIYNFYGNKSNSELLVAYGFLLPQTSNDRVNLKVNPPPEIQQLRRSQACYIPPSENQPEEEFMFNIGVNTNQDITWLSYLSDGLFDTTLCMVSNTRERNWMRKNPDYCPERDVSVSRGYLARSAYQALIVLKTKLELELARLQGSLPRHPPQTPNQHLAVQYRTRQQTLLSTALPLLTQNLTHTPLTTLTKAYTFLSTHYPTLSTAVHSLISTDQEEPLPLNWSILASDWDHTYLIVWIYVLLSLEKANPEDFQAKHPVLRKWLVDAQNVGGSEGSEVGERLFAEEGEVDTINLMVDFVAKQFGHSDATKLRMRNVASFIVKEEAVRGVALDDPGLVQEMFCLDLA